MTTFGWGEQKGQQSVWQIMIEEIVEGFDVQDAVDDGGVGECGSGF